MTRALLIWLAANALIAAALCALALRHRLRDLSAQVQELEADLSTERLHSVHLQRQVTAWQLWWERDGTYLSALAARHQRQTADALIQRVREDAARPLTLEALLKLTNIKDSE